MLLSRCKRIVAGRCVRTFTLAAVACAITARPLPATEPGSDHPDSSAPIVTLLLRDGRRISGELTPRTDSRTVWLQTASGSIVIASGFDWHRVRGVNHQERWLTSAECARLVTQVRTAARNQGADSPHQLAAVPAAEYSLLAHETRPRPVATSRVASLHIEATLANFDSDAEPDGLQVLVTPLDACGVPVPVDGQLEFSLAAETQLRRGGRHDIRSLPLRQQLGEWTRRLEHACQVNGAALVMLEFPGPVNLHEADISPWGVLSARLGVPGQGAFDATADVWLRP